MTRRHGALILAFLASAAARMPIGRYPSPSVALLLHKQQRVPTAKSASPLKITEAAAAAPPPIGAALDAAPRAHLFSGATRLARRALFSVVPSLVANHAARVFDMLPAMIRRPVEWALASLKALVVRAAAFCFGADEAAVETALRWIGGVLFVQLEQRAFKAFV